MPNSAESNFNEEAEAKEFSVDTQAKQLAGEILELREHAQTEDELKHVLKKISDLKKLYESHGEMEPMGFMDHNDLIEEIERALKIDDAVFDWEDETYGVYQSNGDTVANSSTVFISTATMNERINTELNLQKITGVKDLPLMLTGVNTHQLIKDLGNPKIRPYYGMDIINEPELILELAPTQFEDFNTIWEQFTTEFRIRAQHFDVKILQSNYRDRPYIDMGVNISKHSKIKTYPFPPINLRDIYSEHANEFAQKVNGQSLVKVLKNTKVRSYKIQGEWFLEVEDPNLLYNF